MAACGGDARKRGGAKNNPAARLRPCKRSTPSPDQPRHQEPLHLTQLLPLISSAASSSAAFLRRHDLHLLPSQTLTLESHLSSISLSLSSIFSLLPHLLNKPLKPHISSSHCWFQRFLSDASDDYDARWVEAFRMSRQSFSLLLQLLQPSLEKSLPSIPPNYALAAAIFRLAHGASYNAVARRFETDASGACRAFFVVCKAVSDKLGTAFEFRFDMEKVLLGFGWMSLPNCSGVLGIGRFPVDGKILGGNGELLVQALVDSEGRFLDVSAGWPSTMKPDAVLRHSQLFWSVEGSREALNGICYKLNDLSSIPQYILGDSCFPLLPWLLTPFMRSREKSSLRDSERAYNSVHNRGMALVREAFGRLRVLWQILSKRWKEESLEIFPFVVVTCCLLHNFLIKCGEPLPDENDVAYTKERKFPVFDGESSKSGRMIRNALAVHVSRVSSRN